jgi:hypothetical protein
MEGTRTRSALHLAALAALVGIGGGSGTTGDGWARVVHNFNITPEAVGLLRPDRGGTHRIPAPSRRRGGKPTHKAKRFGKPRYRRTCK